MLSAIAKSLFAGLISFLLAGPAMAHGAFVDVAAVDAVGIHARYDTGEPMADAQVAVFAPDALTQPWLVGQTDAEGQFLFTPDDRAGRWAIQVRQAGHGAMGYVELSTEGTAMAITAITASAGLTWAQRLLMLACVLWGAVGTALYFRRAHAGKPA
ncbi:carboxypeptidase regulatory-like domain-containing protein [Yoonia sp.]|uniref:carboxypeptidase regulatory-like domain-containing protein n=1 Tax=Yoonia sp. TaxID=2212373 RepID=UPI00391B449A